MSCVRRNRLPTEKKFCQCCNSDISFGAEFPELCFSCNSLRTMHSCKSYSEITIKHLEREDRKREKIEKEIREKQEKDDREMAERILENQKFFQSLREEERLKVPELPKPKIIQDTADDRVYTNLSNQDFNMFQNDEKVIKYMNKYSQTYEFIMEYRHNCYKYFGSSPNNDTKGNKKLLKLRNKIAELADNYSLILNDIQDKGDCLILYFDAEFSNENYACRLYKI